MTETNDFKNKAEKTIKTTIPNNEATELQYISIKHKKLIIKVSGLVHRQHWKKIEKQLNTELKRIRSENNKTKLIFSIDTKSKTMTEKELSKEECDMYICPNKAYRKVKLTDPNGHTEKANLCRYHQDELLDGKIDEVEFIEKY